MRSALDARSRGDRVIPPRAGFVGAIGAAHRAGGDAVRRRRTTALSRHPKLQPPVPRPNLPAPSTGRAQPIHYTPPMGDVVSHQPPFEGFTASQIDVGEATIYVRHGGGGPPLLLLHGIPETHLMWHKIALRLAADFTVIAADLRGYGESSKPLSTPDHAPYAKRAMAQDIVTLMQQLGFERFFVAGHDRGARVSYRLALDHPERVRKLAVLDIVPTGDALRRADTGFALGFWVWFFLAQPYDLPERVIGAAPQVFLDHMLDSWSTVPASFPPEVREAYLWNFCDPETLHAICEEYRAAVTLDFQHDEADRGKRRITCPVLALWSAEGALQRWYDTLALWRAWADDVNGRALACGHFLPEEAPDETYAELRTFFTANR